MVLGFLTLCYCATENPARFPWVLDTTFEEKIYIIRWCCIDLLSPQPLPEI